MLRKFAQQLCKNLTVETKFQTWRGISISAMRRNDEKTAEKESDAETKPEKTVCVEKDKNITLIGINRPQKANAIDSNTAKQLCEAFREFETDATSPIAVLYGMGGSFCAGYDIFEMDAVDGVDISIDILMMPEGSVGPTRRHISKPVVCGINGYCVANGLELALMCDLRVMEETAILGFFNRRFGVPVIDGGTARLPAMIGISRALDLVLTGRQVNAKEAHQMGIANRIVPTGNSLVCAIELAHQLAKFPQAALNHDRNSLYSATFDSSSFQQSVQNEIMYMNKDIIEQMQAGIRWFNKTFTRDTSVSWWLKRNRSMADWDDADVAEAAAKIEVAKQKQEAERIEAEKEAEKQKEEEKQKKKQEDKPKKKDKEDEKLKEKEDEEEKEKSKTPESEEPKN